MNSVQELAREIRRLAKLKGVNVNTILIECGINKNMINEMERRNSTPSYDKIAKIALYLEVSTDYLLGLTDNPTVTTLNGETIDETEKAGGEAGVVASSRVKLDGDVINKFSKENRKMDKDKVLKFSDAILEADDGTIIDMSTVELVAEDGTVIDKSNVVIVSSDDEDALNVGKDDSALQNMLVKAAEKGAKIAIDAYEKREQEEVQKTGTASD